MDYKMTRRELWTTRYRELWTPTSAYKEQVGADVFEEGSMLPTYRIAVSRCRPTLLRYGRLLFRRFIFFVVSTAIICISGMAWAVDSRRTPASLDSPYVPSTTYRPVPLSSRPPCAPP